MPFSPAVQQEALVRSRRCCCICNEFVGLYTNVHHIQQEADGGANTIENAVVLCLQCHGEVGHYNDRHPFGNKYSPDEVRRHRDNWWEWCSKNPGVPLPKLPITVSPSTSRVATGAWLTKTVVTVANRSDAIYYDVWIKLAFKLVGLTMDDILLDDIALKQQIIEKVGTIEIRGDAWMFLGSDEAGNPGILTLIHSLEPSQTATLALHARDEVVARPGNKSAEVAVSVSSFSPTPEGEFMHTQDKLARSYRFPEVFTIQKTAFKTGKVG